MSTREVRRLRVERATVTLEAPGEAYHGWQATVRLNPPWSIRQRFFELQLQPPQTTADLLPWMNKLLDLLSAILLDWDFVDEEGAPLPPTRAGLEALPEQAISALLTAWLRAMELPKATASASSAV